MSTTGPIHDLRDGSYSFEVTAALTVQAAVKVSVEGLELADSPTIDFVSP